MAVQKGYLKYNPKLKQLSRNLRNHSSIPEILLWQQLRAGQLRGYKFNRQKPLDMFIVDFYCKKLKLVIEIDGENHLDFKSLESDKHRQKKIEKMGLTVLRFENDQVKSDIDSVLIKIEEYIMNFEAGNP